LIILFSELNVFLNRMFAIFFKVEDFMYALIFKWSFAVGEWRSGVWCM